MADSIRIEGLDEVRAMFNNAPRVVDRIGRKWLRDWSIFGVKEVQRHTLNAGAVDTNELIQGIHYTIDNTAQGLQSEIKPSAKADKYAIYVEEGTKPHTPPVSALQGWADRHGIPVWAVIRKIQREGTEPRHMWRDSFEILDRRVSGEINEFGDDLLRNL